MNESVESMLQTSRKREDGVSVHKAEKYTVEDPVFSRRYARRSR